MAGRPPDLDPTPPEDFWEDATLTIRGAVMIHHWQEDTINVVRRVAPLLESLGFSLEYVKPGNTRAYEVHPLPRATAAEVLEAVRKAPGLTVQEIGRAVYAVRPWTEALDRAAAQRARVLLGRMVREFNVLKRFSPTDAGRAPRFFHYAEKMAEDFFGTPAEARAAAKRERVDAVNGALATP